MTPPAGGSAVSGQTLIAGLSLFVAAAAGVGIAGREISVEAWLQLGLHWLAFERLAWRAGVALALGSAAACLALCLGWLAARRQGRAAAPRRGLAIAAGGLLVAGGLVAAALLSRPVPAGPNVLLVVLDTVRQDRLSPYGYGRATTPELDLFAREAIRFDEFYATSSWTLPSHASLFTGLHPVAHRATQERLALTPRFATLAEILRNAGYRTWAASGNPFVGPLTNTDQGFETLVETWSERGHSAEPPPDAPHPANVAFERFLAADPERPFFAFVNYIEAHTPYVPPEGDRARFLRDRSVLRALELGRREWGPYYLEPYSERDLAALSDLYDAELAHLSRVVWELLEVLRRAGRYDDTLIAITSDHGEHFGENGLGGHFFGLYNTGVRVPLLLRPAGGRRGPPVDRRPAQLTDLFATVLAAAAVPAPPGVEPGRDLLDPGARADEAIVSEYYTPLQVLGLFSPEERDSAGLDRYRRRRRAIQVDGWRLIWSSDQRHELYDLTADPGETRDLFATRSDRAAPLLARLEEWVARHGYGPEAPPPATTPDLAVDGAAREALRALGYLDE